MKPKLSSVLREFEKQLDSSEKLVKKINILGIPRIQVEIIAELAFLRNYMAWENFLEESFTRYLIGAESLSGYSADMLVIAQNIDHALQLIYLNLRKKYFQWNSASEVITISEIFFRNGEPYKTALRGAATYLNEMNTIRNRIVHKSGASKKSFNDFIRDKFGHGIKGMTPGRFLLTPIRSTTPTSYLDRYVLIIKDASRMIVR